MSGTLWCVSLEACVATRTCLPVDSPRETAGAVPPATGGTRHGTAAVDPSNILQPQPPGTGINIYLHHISICYRKIGNSIKGAVMRFWESIFIFSNCQLQQKPKLSISLSGPNTGSGAAQGPALGNLNAESN